MVNGHIHTVTFHSNPTPTFLDPQVLPQPLHHNGMLHFLPTHLIPIAINVTLSHLLPPGVRPPVELGDSSPISKACLQKNVSVENVSVHFLTFITILQVKNLMYGFGDDRSPANDTVSVMEEILVEYIADVVRPVVSRLFLGLS
jgi:hypothetical protein